MRQYAEAMDAERKQERLKPGHVRFLLHGRNTDNDEVSGAVFAAKLASLVRALKAADKAVNRRSVHDYTIAKLHSSTPTVVLAEQPVSPHVDALGYHSGAGAFQDCVSAILVGDPERALKYGNCFEHVQKLAKGSRKQFSYAEVWTDDATIFRVDDFLTERARTVMISAPNEMLPSPSTRRWFKGVAHGSFQGTVRAVDLRGSRPELKLILSAGGSTLDCVCRADDIEKIRASLERLVRVYGHALYDGKSGLLRRIEVSDIQPLREGGDFKRWKGSFEPFAAEPWEGDDA